MIDNPALIGREGQADRKTGAGTDIVIRGCAGSRSVHSSDASSASSSALWGHCGTESMPTGSPSRFLLNCRVSMRRTIGGWVNTEARAKTYQTWPSFITKLTFLSAFGSSLGSASRAIMSAQFPFSNQPNRNPHRSFPHASQPTIVPASRASSTDRPASTKISISRTFKPWLNVPVSPPAAIKFLKELIPYIVAVLEDMLDRGDTGSRSH